jgi:hypothetical protein
MIPDEAVEAAARGLHHAEHGPWVSGGGVTPGGTPWGTSREMARKELYLSRARLALEAAAPHLMAIAWDEGCAAHEKWPWEGPNPYRKASE